MKREYVSALILIMFNLVNCSRQDQPQVAGGLLAGNWQGVNETKQIGSCAWNGEASVATMATFQVTNNSVTGTITRGGASQPFSGSLNGNVVKINETNKVACNGVFGTYIARYEGSIDGNTLILTSRDTLCPQQGCIFLRTLKLTRQ